MRITTLFILFITLILKLSGNTIVVGKQGDFPTIKSALRIDQNGDTVLVESGIYKEGNIVITQSIHLLGINMPILDGDRKYEVVSIKASHVVIKGFIDKRIKKNTNLTNRV